MISAKARDSKELKKESKASLEVPQVDYMSELKEVADDLSKASDHLALSEKKDIIPIIGITGAGKSSAINYIKGVDYERVFDIDNAKYRLKKLEDAKEYVTAGHEHESYTTYPQAVPITNENPANTYYLDCPGFKENRENYKVLTNILRQSAIQGSKNIQAMVICFPYNPTDTRERDLDELIDVIDMYFKNVSALPPEKIVIFVTKNTVPELTPAGFLKGCIIRLKETKIKQLKDKEKIKLKKEDKSQSVNRLQEAINILELIERNGEKNIVIVDPTDKGKSRKEVEKIIDRIIKQSGSIPKDCFRLPSRDESYNRFEWLTSRAMSHGIELADKIYDYYEDIANSQHNLQKKRNELKIHQEKSAEIQYLISSNRVPAALELLNSAQAERLSIIHNELNNMTEKKEELSGEMKQLQDTINQLTADATEVPYWTPEPVSFEANKWLIALTAAGTLAATSAIVAWLGTMTVAAAGTAETVGVGVGTGVAGTAVARGAAALRQVRQIAGVIGNGAGAVLAYAAATLPDLLRDNLRQANFQNLQGMDVNNELMAFIANYLRTHTFSHRRVNFKKVILDADHGSFFEERKDEEEKTYRVSFLPNPYVRSIATVKGFVENRHTPETQIRIQLKEGQLTEKKKELKSYEHKYNEKVNEQEALKQQEASNITEKMESITKKIRVEIEGLQNRVKEVEALLNENYALLISEEKVYRLITTLHRISSLETPSMWFLLQEFIDKVSLFINGPSDKESFSPMQRIPSNNDEEWYDDVRVNNLLRYYFSNKEHLKILPALPLNNEEEITSHLIQTRLTVALADNPTTKVFYLPLRINENHWIGLYVDKTTDNPIIYWIDPYGGISEIRKDQIRAILNGTGIFDVVLTNEHIRFQEHRLQKDGVNCGPWIIEILRYILDLGAFPEPGQIDINIWRQIHSMPYASNLSASSANSLSSSSHQASSFVSSMISKSTSTEAGYEQPETKAKTSIEKKENQAPVSTSSTTSTISSSSSSYRTMMVGMETTQESERELVKSTKRIKKKKKKKKISSPTQSSDNNLNPGEVPTFSPPPATVFFKQQPRDLLQGIASFDKSKLKPPSKPDLKDEDSIDNRLKKMVGGMRPKMGQ